MDTISIKNIFVCLDREMFVQDIKEKLTPKFEYEEEDEGNFFALLFRLIALCTVGVFCVANAISSIKNNDDVFGAIACLLFCLLCITLSIFDLRRSMDAMERNAMIPAIGNAFVDYVKEALSNISFDDLVQDSILLNLEDVHYLVWLVYNTAITDISYYKDMKKIVVKFAYEDTTDLVELKILYVNEVEDLDSISIVKDGLIINNLNNVKAHSIRTITLS